MLIVVRHGQTAANASGLLLGRADVPLTEHGRRQAAALAAALPRPARLVSSPLGRARATAAAFGCPVEVDERWIELDYGTLDEQPVSSVDEDVWRRWRADGDYVPAGGEALSALGARVRQACDDLADEATRSHVVVVTHVSPIKAAVAWALGVDDAVAWRLHVADASVARIAVGPHGPALHSFNERFPPPDPSSR
ncbi:MAG: histidine phosphatase family protein [Acidimicrobiales bacterium]